MIYSESSYKAARKYKASKIKRIPLDVQVEMYQRIKDAAESAGESINGYIKTAIINRMEQEGAATPGGIAQTEV